jgi:hypothetical protein
VLERGADERLGATLERALVTAALARALNGVISVAQGTEIAVQPIGIGLTITAGQILDPVNDLIERFSWLALVASASLGTQVLLTEIAAEAAVSQVLAGVVVIALLLIWWPGTSPGTDAARRFGLRLAVIAVFARFVFTLVALAVGWVDGWVLEARQEAALSGLSTTREQIAELETATPTPIPDPSLSDRLSGLIDEGRQLLDLESQLTALQERAESAIDHLLTLTVLFVVQTLLVPIGAFWLSLAAFRWLWSWLRGSGAD